MNREKGNYTSHILTCCFKLLRARVNKNIWAFLSIWQVEHHPLTHTTNSRLLPSGDSSCTYVPVRYRWTKADFPLDRLPTMPCKVKSKMLWLFLTGGHDRNKPQADVERTVMVTWQNILSMRFCTLCAWSFHIYLALLFTLIHLFC